MKLANSGLRAVTVGFEDIRKLKVTCYLGREARDEDYKNIFEIAPEVCGDIDFKEVEENCVYSLQPFAQSDSLGLHSDETVIFLDKDLLNFPTAPLFDPFQNR